MGYDGPVAMEAHCEARIVTAQPVGDSDDALMARFRCGDAKAFDQLYRRYRGPLYRVLLRLTRSAADTEEIFQEVWIAVLDSGDRYSGKGRFAAWLFAIAHRRRIDRLRSLGRRRQAEAAASELIAEMVDPGGEAGLDAADMGRALLAGIAALPLPQREAFLLQAEGGLTLEEIALVTEAGRETVKSRLRYANQRLRQIVDAHR